MPSLDRRQFVRGVGAAGLASLGPALRLGPPRRSDEVRMAVVGVRSRGVAHMNGFQKLAGVDVVALCDVDAQILAARSDELARKKREQGDGWAGAAIDTYTDVRRLLERGDIDAISIATPNHLHALYTIWACQAGKDVYVEKPVSHNLYEGRQMVRAARKYGRVVQAGMQSRSSSAIREALEWAREGNLGKPRLARGTCFKPRPSIGKVDGPQPIPDYIDWDLYCGPAPLGPLLRRELHYDWHWQFPTGNGDLGNQGVHQMDLCRWAIGARELAPAVGVFGGRLGYEDDGDTPNTLCVLLAYEPVPILFEVRGLPREAALQAENWNLEGMDRYRGSAVGATLECEGGWLHLPNYRSAVAFDSKGVELRRWEGADSHFANFIDAVLERRPEALTADVLEGHLSAGLCHQGNISYQRGKALGPDALRNTVGENTWGGPALEEMIAHLERNGVDLETTPLRLGPWLEFDPSSERCTSDPEANHLLSRAYRPPFVVPQEV